MADGRIGGLKDVPLLGRSNFSSRLVERINLGGPLTDSGDLFGFRGQPPSSSIINQQHLLKDNVKQEDFRAVPKILPSRKVFFICSCMPERTIDDFEDDFHIYGVDLNEDCPHEWSLRDPMIRFGFEEFECFYVSSFCVLGTTDYAFESSRDDHPDIGKRVVTFEMPSSDTVNRRLKKNDLVEISHMRYKKIFPVATPTPDGRILAFSTRFHFNTEKHSDFEIYDPQEKIWIELPSRCDEWKKKDDIKHNYYDSSCKVLAYSFINGGPVLFLRTDAGLFTFEVEPPYNGKCWKRIGYRKLPQQGYSIFIIEDVLCLSDQGSYEIGKRGVYDYPQLSSLGSDYIYKGRAMSLVDVTENEKCIFCVVVAQFNERTEVPYIILNVYSLDVLKYKQKKDMEDKENSKWFEEPDISVLNTKWFEEPDISVLKSFKFQIGSDYATFGSACLEMKLLLQ